MAANKYSFIIEEGATFHLGITWVDADGLPMELSGSHARMQLRPSVESDIVLLDLSSSLSDDGSGILLLHSGNIHIDIAATSTELLNVDEAVYDLEIINDTYVTRLMEGKVRISRNVTR